jgi:hypothetical protein
MRVVLLEGEEDVVLLDRLKTIRWWAEYFWILCVRSLPSDRN